MKIIDMRVLRYLIYFVFVLAFANFIDFLLGKPLWTITRIIALGSDCNFSAWYSSILLFLGFIVGWESTILMKEKRLNMMPILYFSLLLLLMSADEISQFHEIMGGLLSKYTGISSWSCAVHTAWVWVGAPILLFLFVGMIFVVKESFKIVPEAYRYVILGFVCIFLGGVILEATTNFLNHENLEWVWEIEIILEESLEMIGSIFLLKSLILLRDVLEVSRSGKEGVRSI